VICGVDEAGRGPVLGPLVVAAVMVEDDQQLRDLGVKDSKKMTATKRAQLAPEIRKIAQVEVRVIDASTIDARGEERSLNELELDYFAEVIEALRPHRAYVDACDPVEINFSRSLAKRLSYGPELVCEHKADDKYPTVSAASIIAKDLRDMLVHKIGDEIGQDIGSGYPGDEVTIRFLTNWIKEKGVLPPHARSSWETSRRLLRESKIRKISEWE
jgi:ribonuclease HII